VLLVETLLEAGADPNYTADGDENSMLNFSCYAFAPRITKALLDAGADPDHIDDHGDYPLHDATIEFRRSLGRIGVKAKSDGDLERKHALYVQRVKNLLDAGADPDVLDTRSVTKMPPITRAIDAKEPEVLRLLLEAGADPNVCLKDKHCKSPLDAAIRSGEPRFVSMLLDAGASPVARMRLHELDYTPLELSRLYNEVPETSALIEKKIQEGS